MDPMVFRIHSQIGHEEMEHLSALSKTLSCWLLTRPLPVVCGVSLIECS